MTDDVSSLPDSPPPAPGLGISAVERETGLAKDVLRAWERRYGFPQPVRDAHGDRVYSLEQVHTLKVLRQLLDQGHRPGRIVGQPLEALEGLLAPSTAVDVGARLGASPLGPWAAEVLRLLQSHQTDALRRALAEQLWRQGVGRFVVEDLAPLVRRVGELWEDGTLAIFEEHVFSECVQQVLRQALQTLPRPSDPRAPRVLLTSVPGEAHGLGLLMVEALLALEGCACVSAGVQTPLAEIVAAAEAHRIDIVGLSFTGVMPNTVVHTALSQLRAMLPPHVALWAGGSASLLHGPLRLHGVEAVVSLSQIREALARWRTTRAP